MAEIVASAGPMWRQYEFGSITLKHLSEPRSSFRRSRQGAIRFTTSEEHEQH
jgi:hypothetical protein